MVNKAYPCGDNFEEVCQRLGIKYDDCVSIFNALRHEGYTEKGICCAAGKAEDKLLCFIHDDRFPGIFKNEIRKHALKPGDPRWEKKKSQRK